MGIFTRFKDIISSNINSILDSAEDPEKMLKLMIREMEDTLVELKTSCASVMADEKQTSRQIEETKAIIAEWIRKAELAIKKERDDLAKEALIYKKEYEDRLGSFEKELVQSLDIVAQYQEDIARLEEKIKDAREKLKLLVQRQIKAKEKIKSESSIRKFDANNAMLKFEQYESRIDQLEAEAELINPKGKKSIEDEFSDLESESEIDKELASLKSKLVTNQNS